MISMKDIKQIALGSDEFALEQCRDPDILIGSWLVTEEHMMLASTLSLSGPE